MLANTKGVQREWIRTKLHVGHFILGHQQFYNIEEISASSVQLKDESPRTFRYCA